MKKFFSALAAGAKAMTEGPTGEQFEVAGRPVRCAHCGGEHFVEGRAQPEHSGHELPQPRLGEPLRGDAGLRGLRTRRVVSRRS